MHAGLCIFVGLLYAEKAVKASGRTSSRAFDAAISIVLFFSAFMEWVGRHG
jgi:hypothetical protein